jgi:hypothetical protein
MTQKVTSRPTYSVIPNPDPVRRHHPASDSICTSVPELHLKSLFDLRTVCPRDLLWHESLEACSPSRGKTVKWKQLLGR